MTNSINSVNVNTTDVFAPFQPNGANYAITKPITPEQEIKTEEHKKKKVHALGYSLAVTALVAGFGVFGIMKGLPKGARGQIDKVLRYLEEKTSTMANNKSLSGLQIIYLNFLKRAKSLATMSKATFNSAPIKDALVRHWMQKLPILKKIDDSVTRLFEKISMKTSHKQYRRTLTLFENMQTAFDKAGKQIPKEKLAQKITINGQTKTVKQWLEIVKQKSGNIKTTYNNGFNEATRINRLQKAKENLGDISQRIYQRIYGNLKGFVKDKKTYQTFISEEEAAPAKIKLQEEVNAIRAKITNNINDNYAAGQKTLGNIYSFLDPADTNARTIMKQLRNLFEEYKTLSGSNETAQRAIVNKKIFAALKQLNSHIKQSEKYDGTVIKQISQYLQGLQTLLSKRKKGELEEILTIYRKILPDNEYQALKKTSEKAAASLAKSVDIETDKLFDKIRDLQIGSAPVDLLGVLTSAGVIGFGLTKADDKDQRISVALKYGIPAVGAIAISLYCTVGLISGGASLAIGLLSGIAINKLGEFADEQRKKYQKKPVKLPEVKLPEIKMPELSLIGDNKSETNSEKSV